MYREEPQYFKLLFSCSDADVKAKICAEPSACRGLPPLAALIQRGVDEGVFSSSGRRRGSGRALRRRGAASPLRVVAFDLDGTLLSGTTISLFLARRLGRTGELDALERRFRAGEISNAAIADASAAWFGGMRRSDVWRLLEGAPWIPGIGPTVTTLRAEGYHAVVATITWRFAAELLQHRFGFGAVSGTEMGEVDGRLTGVVSRHFDEYDKLAFVETFCAGRGLSLAHCAAVGDSRSDLPLFGRAGLAIALNATPDARAAAHVVLAGKNLRVVLKPILRHPWNPLA